VLLLLLTCAADFPDYLIDGVKTERHHKTDVNAVINCFCSLLAVCGMHCAWYKRDIIATFISGLKIGMANVQSTQIFFLGRLFDRIEADLKCLSVHKYMRTYVCPSTKSLFDFNELWHVGRGRWVMHSSMQYVSKVKLTSPSKLELRPFSKPISSTIYNGNWKLTTDSQTRAQYPDVIRPDFKKIFGLLFVSHDFEVGTNVSSEESTISLARS